MACYNTVDTVNTDNTERRRRCRLKKISGKRDVYIEVAERYEKFIRLGVLSDGDRLPSVRVAAGELGVNPNTVQRAYTLLEEKGLIRSVLKKGAFVTFLNESVPNERSNEIERAKKALSELKESGISFETLSELLKEVYEQ